MMSGAGLAHGLSPARQALDNGVVILAQENTAAPAVAINATFLAGSVDDPPGRPGVAYMTRRTIDRGTESRSGGDIAEILDDRGVSLRVSASRHAITLSCICLVEDYDEILALLADIARRPVFPADEIARRRREAITAVRERQDDPSRVSIALLLERLYGPDHPYGRPSKGTVASLETIDRDDLVAFHARYVVPSALRIAIAGALPPGAAIDTASRVFGDWTGGPRPDEPFPPPPVHTARVFESREMPGKSQSDIGYGFTTIRRLDPRYHAYSMMNNVLGQFGLGGRLADSIRERQGMAYYAYSTLEARVGEGPLLIRVGVDPANVARAIDAIDVEVRGLGTDGPTPAEFDDTRESLIGSIPRMLETNESIADFLIHAEQFDLGLDYDRRLPSLLRAVTLDEVREAAAEVLDPARAVVTVAGPAE